MHVFTCPVQHVYYMCIIFTLTLSNMCIMCIMLTLTYQCNISAFKFSSMLCLFVNMYISLCLFLSIMYHAPYPEAMQFHNILCIMTIKHSGFNIKMIYRKSGHVQIKTTKTKVCLSKYS